MHNRIKKRVWDLPTRLFHWLLLASIVSQYVTVELLDNAMDWHFYGGYFILGLLIFRILWLFLGTKYALLKHFVLSLNALSSYTKTLFDKAGPQYSGHNPMGSYAVLLMLGLIIAQATSGLFISDEIFHQGPYFNAVSADWQDIASTIHHTGFDILKWIIGLHIGIAFFYQFYKKQLIITAMFTGKKTINSGEISQHYWIRFVTCCVLVALTLYAILVYFVPEANDFYY